MHEYITRIRDQEETILNLEAERDTYKLLTWMAVAGMVILTVGFIVAVKM